jgi:hypothetical protein
MSAKTLTALTLAGLFTLVGSAHAAGTNEGGNYPSDTSTMRDAGDSDRGAATTDDNERRGPRSDMPDDTDERPNAPGAEIDSNTGGIGAGTGTPLTPLNSGDGELK